MDDKKIQSIIEHFLETASEHEIREFKALLKNRNLKKGLSSIGEQAHSMASQIQEQLGITEKTIKRTARNVVASLAKQYNPKFTDAEIQAIVNEMVPERKKKVSIPPDMLFTMIQHFVDYSTGRMENMNSGEFPKGWQKKYWHSFPADVQKLIAALLKDTLDEDTFWQRIRSLLFR